MVAEVGVLLTGLIENADPLHIVWMYADNTGFGFTVTVTRNVGPTQAPAAPEVGVTV